MSEVELCEVGDQHNWKYAWFTEHHFLEEYSHISANEVLMPWVLARTEQIHVGSGIINVTPPVNHPARVAERVAMMDHVSGGRFEFGTGRGSSTTEMGGFGITDPEITRDDVRRGDRRVQEDVGRRQVLVRRPVLHDARAQRVAEALREAAPADVGRGRQPRARSRRPGALGLGVLCFTGGSPQKMAPLIEIYKKAIANAEPVGEFVNDNVAVTTSFMCLEDRDQARDLMTHSGNGRQQTLVFHYLDTFPKPPFVPEWPTEIPDPTLEDIDKGLATRRGMVGTPDECAAGVQKWVDVGVDQLIMGPSGSTFPHELLAETVTLFGDEVIPRFDKDPEHSTSRYRREAAAGSAWPDAAGLA